MNKISEVAGHIRQADGVCFIIGAGASLSAGIPSASRMVDLACEQFDHCLTNLSETDRKDYGKVMSQLSPAEREKFISPLLHKSGINWGQIALAAMAEQKKISRILTFNFDLVLEKATALLGLRLPVYDFAAAPTADIKRIARSAILHLHGQSHGLVLLNSETETKKHKELLRPLLKDTVQNHVTIVIGYSGESDGAYNVIEEEFNSNNRLIWLGHNNEAAPHLRSLFQKDYAEYIGSCDFDKTMIEIARELSIWPPAIFNNPMQHLISELEPVRDFPTDDENDLDILSNTREKLKKYSEKWVAESGDDEQAIAALLSGQLNSIKIELSGTLTEKGAEALAWSYINQGNSLVKKAEKLSKKDALHLFHKSNSLYAEAIKIHPNAQAFFNWGVNLLREAEMFPDNEPHKKYTEASSKYKEAINIKSDYHEAFNNWGTALLRKAQILPNNKALETLQESCEKYEEAIEIRPDKYESLNNWGTALLEQAKILSGKEASKKFNECYSKFSNAIKIKPDFYEAFDNWGQALSQEALNLSNEKALTKFREACLMHAKALEIKSNYHQAFDNWGFSLLHIAQLLPKKEKEKELKEAKSKLLNAQKLELKANYNLACLYTITGKITDAINQLNACYKDNTLPDINHLLSDKDLDLIRNEDSFKTLIQKLES
ncbi:SIR2 family protein [uncultured Kiloniella sp.]|uniref:TPR end-of-group domain-containing protein n=1 Tax=uncultured Kiloniella sp. TaxID=1133091 RepID=UPI0026181C51|nr:SIR2 family protein [uncultured Kiloniella sp.]